MAGKLGVAGMLLVLAAAPALAVPPGELEPYSFLIGKWAGSGGGGPGSGSGTAEFTRGLQDRVILRTNFAEYPAGQGKPASRHDDLMVMYVVPGAGVRADYFDSEGHVIHYAVASPSPGQAVFLSEAPAGQPRFRLRYRLKEGGILEGDFATAPPDSPEAFKPYLTWESRKK